MADPICSSIRVDQVLPHNSKVFTQIKRPGADRRMPQQQSISSGKGRRECKSNGFFPPDIETKVLQYAEFCKFLKDNQNEHPLMPYILTKVGEIGQVIQAQKRYWDRWKMDELNTNLSELGSQLEILNGMQNSMVKHELQLATSQIQKQEWEGRFHMAKDRLAMLKNKLSLCEQRLIEQEQELRNLEVLLKEKEDAIQHAEYENDQLQNQCNAIEDLKLQAEHGQVRLSEQLEKAQTKARMLQQEIDHLTGECGMWKRQSEEYKEAVALAEEKQKEWEALYTETLYKTEEATKVFESRKNLDKQVQIQKDSFDNLLLMRQHENASLLLQTQQMECVIERNRLDYENKLASRDAANLKELKKMEEHYQKLWSDERVIQNRDWEAQVERWKIKCHNAQLLGEKLSNTKKELDLVTTKQHQSEDELLRKTSDLQNALRDLKQAKSMLSAHESNLSRLRNLLGRELPESSFQDSDIVEAFASWIKQQRCLLEVKETNIQYLKTLNHKLSTEIDSIARNAKKKFDKHMPTSKQFDRTDLENASQSDLRIDFQKFQLENLTESKELASQHRATVKNLYIRINELEGINRNMSARQRELEGIISSFQKHRELRLVQFVQERQSASLQESCDQSTQTISDANFVDKMVSDEVDALHSTVTASRGTASRGTSTDLSLDTAAKVNQCICHHKVQEANAMSSEYRSHGMHRTRYEDLLEKYNESVELNKILQRNGAAEDKENAYTGIAANIGPQQTNDCQDYKTSMGMYDAAESALKLQEAKYEIEKLRFEVSRMEQEIRKLRQRTSQSESLLQTKVAIIESLEEALQSQTKSYEDDINHQTRLLREENSQMGELVAHWRELHEEQDACFDKLAQVELAFDEKCTELLNLQQSHCNLRSKLTKLESQLSNIMSTNRQHELPCRTDERDQRKMELRPEEILREHLMQILVREGIDIGLDTSKCNFCEESLKKLCHHYKMSTAKHVSVLRELGPHADTCQAAPTAIRIRDGCKKERDMGGITAIHMLNQHLSNLMKQNVKLQHQNESYKALLRIKESKK